jgi:hypothetical protein
LRNPLLKQMREMVDKYIMTAQPALKNWCDVDGRQIPPNGEAIVKTSNNFTCLAALQNDGSWREVYGRKERVEVTEVVLSF